MEIRLSPLRFFLGVNAILLGLGFVRYFGQSVTASATDATGRVVSSVTVVPFPWFPNVLDSAFMVGVGILLLRDTVIQSRRRSSSAGDASGRGARS